MELGGMPLTTFIALMDIGVLRAFWRLSIMQREIYLKLVTGAGFGLVTFAAYYSELSPMSD
ncbi:hypothetical protein [Shewanella halotolerans]|uniref:hypothetical protein n=1 Tax=Shewanella halotolerans TaxID=2864204 RepID=UPI001C654F31|nr:hypothetical protein [Shewanella halotolerans]QYJ88297.1 hypothetical protein K0H81_10735 [Shewanella halotolerans]